MQDKDKDKEYIPAEKVLHTDHIRGVAGYLLLQQMAIYVGQTDRVLDCRKIDIPTCYFNSQGINDVILDFTYFLQDQGYMVSKKRGKCKGIYSENFMPDQDLIKSGIPLWDERSRYNYWSMAKINEIYPSKYLSKLSSYEHLVYFVLYLVGKELIDLYDQKTKKPLMIEFDIIASQCMLMFLPLLKVEHILNKYWKSSPLEVKYDKYTVETERKLDFEYKMFFDEAVESGQARFYSNDEKQELVKSLHLKKGTVVALYERCRMSPYRSWGDIVNSKIAIYEGMDGNSILLRTLNISKTKEELENEMLDLTEEDRLLVSDMLFEKKTAPIRKYPLHTVGIEHCFCASSELSTDFEPYLLFKLNTENKVDLYIRKDGVLGTYRMSEAEAVYWILKEYEEEFDEKLYKEMYADGFIE